MSENSKKFKQFCNVIGTTIHNLLITIYIASIIIIVMCMDILFGT